MMPRDAQNLRLKGAIALAACCAGLIVMGSLVSTPCRAASIPAWLDDAITSRNEKDPSLKIQFIAIKDSFVWYEIPATPERGGKQIRGVIDTIAQQNGYGTSDGEEIVTTGKPPAASGPATAKKCWSRSFVLDLQKNNNTNSMAGDPDERQRMLTRLVCEDNGHWDAGFRIIE